MFQILYYFILSLSFCIGSDVFNSQFKNTTPLLEKLRSLMENTTYVDEPLGAYIIPSNDAHSSEYIADSDKRREFISGFTGSAGTAIVTKDKALLWTDSRYFLQASEQLDSNWELMKDGLASTPSQEKWLSQNLPKGSKVGVDPKLMTYRSWLTIETQLKSTGHELVPVVTNLIDIIWKDRPEVSKNPIIPLHRNFSGKLVHEKLTEVNDAMTSNGVEALVLTALDEVAWFLNLRGSDITYNPVFFAYVIIFHGNFTIFVDKERYTNKVKSHLEDETNGTNFTVESYDDIGDYLKNLSENFSGSISLSTSSNYYLIHILNGSQLHLTTFTPVSTLKMIKNSVEMEGMRNAHIKDSVALIAYFAWLEDQLGRGNAVTEVSGAQVLEEFRSQQKDFVGPSFATISAFGIHGAIVHYEPTNETDIPITTDNLYLCDSGGQYLDGTTDITRTLHFGQPTEHQKEMFTLVLKGQLKLANAVFPKNIRGNSLDSFAREFMWREGVEYSHGTSHGVGAYLFVHEGPSGIQKRERTDDPGFSEGMFMSNEPGYYEDGNFGIRIEDVVEVVTANTTHNFNNMEFCAFETISFVPKQLKMIKVEMLTNEEIQLLNKYHEQCRDVIGPILEKEGRSQALEWLRKETETIPTKTHW